MFVKKDMARRLFSLFNSSMIIFVLIIALIIIHYFYLNRGSRSSQIASATDEMVLETLGFLSSSLPYYEYERKMDSTRQAIENEHNFSKSTYLGFGFLPMGTSTYDEATNPRYYFYLKGYRFEDSYAFTKHGKNYIKYTVWDNIVKSGTSTSMTGHYEIREIGIKIMQRKNSDDLVLLFQINRTTSVIIYIAIISLGILLMATGLYFLVVLPAKFLYFVAKGRVFTDETIGMLYVISCFLILLGLIPGIVRCIFHLIFKSQIPDEVRFSFFEAIMSTSGFLIAGLITLLLAKAFLKGSQILKEQELTV